jgi:signal transduction histidine kinase
VRAAFHDPPVAFFSPDHDDPELWRCWRQQHLPTIPTTFGVGVVTTHLVRPMGVIDARAMHHALATATLERSEQQLVYAPDIALWCPLYHSEGALLGLLLIGPDRTLDPYRDRDLHELQRLMDAASLAFTNSAMYRQRCDAEALVRQLYESLQRAQDETASAIAREIHDEVLNINVRLNIQSIQELLATHQPPTLHHELEELLESEQTIGRTLRRLCELLYPTGMDDPYGLPQALRLQNARLQATWRGVCQIDIVGDTHPIAPAQQRATLRIAKEAVTNAIRHAHATTITTTLFFPTPRTRWAELRIEDDGRTKQRVVPKPGHWGVLNMRESARMAGGALDIRPRPDGGTAVVFTFPTAAAPTNDKKEHAESRQ